jgi:hypothetical protein
MGPATTPAEEVRDATVKLGALRRKMTFILTLSPAERQEHRRARIGAKAIRTLDNRVAAAKQNPNLLPPAFDLAKFEQDAALTSALNEYLATLDSVRGEVHDTYLAVANRAIVAATTAYSHIMVASNTAARLKRTVEKLAARPSSARASSEPVDPAPSASSPEAANQLTPPITPADKAA